MSEWQDEDEVTTNFRTIKMAAQENFDLGLKVEQKRIIDLLLDLKVIRRCAATNKLVAVTTDMEEVVYLTGFENA